VLAPFPFVVGGGELGVLLGPPPWSVIGNTVMSLVLSYFYRIFGATSRRSIRIKMAPVVNVGKLCQPARVVGADESKLEYTQMYAGRS
jgi:hypothetical protein